MNKNQVKIIVAANKRELKLAMKQVSDLIKLNNMREPNVRIETPCCCIIKGNNILYVDGTAGAMIDMWKAFFTQHPEQRIVVQRALDSMFKVVGY